SAIYDPPRDRILIFGGYNIFLDGQYYRMVVFDDVWALTLSGTPAWSRVAVGGSGPGARASHTAVYDPVDDAMIGLGGGSSQRPTMCDDTWSLSLSGIPRWQQLAISGAAPAGRV